MAPSGKQKAARTGGLDLRNQSNTVGPKPGSVIKAAAQHTCLTTLLGWVYPALVEPVVGTGLTFSYKDRKEGLSA